MSSSPSPEPPEGAADLPAALLDEVFAALHRSTDAEAELARLCARHPAHADAIRAHVAAAQATVAHADGVAAAASAPIGRVGPFRLASHLGAGGMGTVYLAEQEEPVRRRVALKLIRAGIDSPELLQRFHRECQALAVMNHDAIARVIDAGATDDGRPWVAMELVEQGLPITEHCDRERLSLRQRIELLQEVCAGVQHAHQKGIVHRDLKPSNLLACRQGGRHVVKIIDFGIARAVDDAHDDGGLQTTDGSMVGTPEYMAPEQAGGHRMQIDTRTDVYALGVVLYELLTGCLPFSSEDLPRHDPIEVARVLRSVEPPRPSAHLGRTTTGSERRSQLRGDLDWIVLKALSKEPDRRYPSVEALAADLQRYLDHEPVLAGPPTWRYRLGKYVRRNRVPFAASVAVGLSVVVGLVLALRFGFEADRQRARAATHLERFQQLRNVVRLDRAREALPSTWPATPANLPKLEDWLRRYAEPLLATLPELRRARSEIEEAARPWTDERRRLDRVQHPQLAELQRRAAELADLERAAQVRRGQREVEVPSVPADAAGLDAWRQALYVNARADTRVGGERTIFGELLPALAVARAAASAAGLAGRDDAFLAAYTAFVLGWTEHEAGLDEAALATAQRVRDLAPAARRPCFEMLAARIERAVATARAGADLERVAELRVAVAALRTRVNARRTWSYRNDEHAFLRRTLADIVRDIESLRDEDVTAVRERVRWAGSIERASFGHPHARVSWQQARAAIRAADGAVASERYRSDPPLDLQPQLGLVPIGMNPRTKLWEFYHLRSAGHGQRVASPSDLPIPSHAADGSIDVDRSTGIVFVLLPGGRDWVGSQTQDPEAPNYEPRNPWESREAANEVELAPFFLARHELTQAQYCRLTGLDNPSLHRPGQLRVGCALPVQWHHPVDQVNWHDARRTLTRVGLALPTEAQWEFACRAGTDTPYFWGTKQSAVVRFANVHSAAGMFGVQRTDDGWGNGTAPVGWFAPNPWGFFDLAGNVHEWCEDPFVNFEPSTTRPGDGLRLGGTPDERVLRGGSFRQECVISRSARREQLRPDDASGAVGFRAARAVR